MALKLGDNLRLSIDTKEIIHEVSAKLDFSREFKEVATKDTSGKLVSPGSYTWGMSIDAKWDNDGTTQEDLAGISAMAIAGTTHALLLSNATSGDVTYAGTGYVADFNVDATNEDYVSVSFSLKGSGDLTQGVVA
tara:strand:- start:1820 stop:2224 length:405 start_codon:yes stop_codon:yes gene_type:complete